MHGAAAIATTEPNAIDIRLWKIKKSRAHIQLLANIELTLISEINQAESMVNL